MCGFRIHIKKAHYFTCLYDLHLQLGQWKYHGSCQKRLKTKQMYQIIIKKICEISRGKVRGVYLVILYSWTISKVSYV
jgi:hypothetical protein